MSGEDTSQMDDTEESSTNNVMVQFISESNEEIGEEFQLSSSADTKDLTSALQSLLPQDDDDTRYYFFVDNQLVSDTLRTVLDATGHESHEKVVNIRYQPQAPFRVRPVERCTASIEGHGEAIVALRFSPNSKGLATASGDTTVRFWDINTQTPLFTCKGHRQWVLSLEWSPDSKRLASACKAGEVIIWDPDTGKRLNTRPMARHKQWINALAWRPLHLDGTCRYLASASKDCTVIVWDTVRCDPMYTLSSHTKSVTCVRWGGSDLLYTCGQDCEVKVWKDGSFVRSMKRHAHWVNAMALSTDYVLRTGACYPAALAAAKLRLKKQPVPDSEKPAESDHEEMQRLAKEIYLSVTKGQPERMVSCSDDHTLFLWHPSEDSKPVARMTGHLQTVIDVKFSPDGRWVVSASFDKSIKLWNGMTGAFIATLRGHVNRVYQLAWAGDSRLLVSGSVDSTLKLWNLQTCLDPQKRTGARGDGRKPIGDLPGHADEIYAVDWSPNGQMVASGGKDRVLKLWQY